MAPGLVEIGKCLGHRFCTHMDAKARPHWFEYFHTFSLPCRLERAFPVL